MDYKELFNKSSQNYYKAIREVREIASAYLKEIVRSKGGKITDDDDDELLDGIAIAYDDVEINMLRPSECRPVDNGITPVYDGDVITRFK